MIVYWIHSQDQVDIYREGYVGITIDYDRRYKEYFSKGHGNRVLREAIDNQMVQMDVYFEGSEAECLELENKLRPNSMTGWNVAVGGICPPDVTGIKDSPKTRELKSKNNVGMKGRKHSAETKARMSKSRKGRVAWNKGIPHTHTKISCIICRKECGNNVFNYHYKTHNTHKEKVYGEQKSVRVKN